MAVIKTEAFVLNNFCYGDSSKIVTLFTKDFGKLKAIVKGVRNYKSKMNGTLETMNYINAVIYIKNNRELQLISNAEHVKSFKNIFTDFRKLHAAYKIIELLNKTVAGQEKNISLFELLIRSYETLNSTPYNSFMIVLYFQIQLCSILGIGGDFSSENGKSETFFKLIELSEIKNLHRLFQFLDEMNFKNAELDDETLSFIVNKFEKYLQLHSIESKNYKTTRVFRDIEESVLKN